MLVLPILSAVAASPETPAASAPATPAAEVAGLRPFQRPEGAPVIREFRQDAAWTARALTGIAAPHTGLGFLKDQGAWFTPFTHPNLKGGYDIRGLHAARQPPRKGN